MTGRIFGIALLVTAIGFTAGLAASWGEDGRIRTGRMIYEEHCFRCHGLNGEGDGPMPTRSSSGRPISTLRASARKPTLNCGWPPPTGSLTRRCMDG
jgi:hypothetical protein